MSSSEIIDSLKKENLTENDTLLESHRTGVGEFTSIRMLWDISIHSIEGFLNHTSSYPFEVLAACLFRPDRK